MIDRPIWEMTPEQRAARQRAVDMALDMNERAAIADRKHREWLEDRPCFRLYREMFTRFHGLD